MQGRKQRSHKKKSHTKKTTLPGLVGAQTEITIMLEKQLEHLHFSLRCIQEGEEERDAVEEALHTHIAWLRIGMDKYVSLRKKKPYLDFIW